MKTDTFSIDTKNRFNKTQLWKPWMDERRLWQATSLEEFRHYLGTHQSDKRISLDFETYDLSQTPESVCGFCLAFDDREGVYIPIKHVNYPSMNLDPDKAWEILLNALKNRQVAVYNWKFEGSILRKLGYLHGCTVDCLQDAMVYRWLLEAHKKQFNLKDAAQDLIGCAMLQIHEVPGVKFGKKKNALNFSLSNPEEATLYAAADPIFTLSVLDHCKKKVDKEQSFIVQLEHALFESLFRMEESPITIHRAYLQQAKEDLDHWIDSVTATMFAKAGREFDVESPKQVSQVLKDMGVPLKRTSNVKQENFETGAKALERFQKDFPIVADILFLRSLKREKSTYVDALLNNTSEERPTAVFKFTSTGAPTGRFASGGVEDGDPFYTAMNVQAVVSSSEYRAAKARKVLIQGLNV